MQGGTGGRRVAAARRGASVVYHELLDVADEDPHAAAGLAENRAIMSASLIGSADIERELSDGGPLDEADKPSAAMAALMLHECLRNYSMRYNQLREERLKRRDAEQK